MAEEITKFNIPGESRNKYGNGDFFDDAGDDFARALNNGGTLPDGHTQPQRTNEVDDDVLSAARDSSAKYGR